MRNPRDNPAGPRRTAWEEEKCTPRINGRGSSFASSHKNRKTFYRIQADVLNSEKRRTRRLWEDVDALLSEHGILKGERTTGGRPRAGRVGRYYRGKPDQDLKHEDERQSGAGPVTEAVHKHDPDDSPVVVTENSRFQHRDSMNSKDSSRGAARPLMNGRESGYDSSQLSAKQPPGIQSSEPREPLAQQKLRLLYMVALYTRDTPTRSNVWVRSLPLMVILYEAIIQGCIDHDYAPQAARVGGKRRYLNFSQEGRDDLDDLREAGLVMGLKLTSERYQSQLAVRITPKGEAYLDKHITAKDKEEVDELMFVDSPKRGPELCFVTWDQGEEKFAIRTDSGFQRYSSITDLEAVSYVSSPYLPPCLKTYEVEMQDNSDRMDLMRSAVTNIKDELDENLLLDHVHLYIVEWIPQGGNQIVALNDKLGSSERVQGGFFTAITDEAPDATQFRGKSEGLSAVNVLDYDETAYVNFEAEVYFPEEEGIIQLENFGIHFHESGNVLYCLRVEAVMDRQQTGISLDLLSRLLVDVQEDSSRVVANLLSGYQRSMLDLVFLTDAENRDKYTIILAEGIQPKLPAEKYMDKEDNENEIKQVIGDTYNAYNITEDEVLVFGKAGMLYTGPNSRRHEPMLCTYASLQARNIFMRTVFTRCFILADVLLKARNIINTYECNPDSINIIRETLSECTEDCITLGEIQIFLTESCESLDIPQPIEGDAASEELALVLKLDDLLARIHRRAVDVHKTIEGCQNELNALREMGNVISEALVMRTQEGLEQNTKNLEDCFRAGARNSTSLEIINIVFAGSLAFKIVDRVSGVYLSVAPDIEWIHEPGGFVEYLVYKPGVYLVLNLAMWYLMGWGLIWMMRMAAFMGCSVESSKMKLNQPVSLDQLHFWLETKNVSSEDIDMDQKTFIKKYTWVEAPKEVWQGMPPKVEMIVDERYCFILQIYIVINKRRCKITTLEVKEFIFEELNKWRVLGAATGPGGRSNSFGGQQSKPEGKPDALNWSSSLSGGARGSKEPSGISKFFKRLKVAAADRAGSQ